MAATPAQSSSTKAPAFTPLQRKNAALWLTRNAGGRRNTDALECPRRRLPGPRQRTSAAAAPTLPWTPSSPTESHEGRSSTEILRGNIPGGAPAVIFTGSHGTQYPPADAAQRERQGALITQEWLPGAVVGPPNQFAAEDVPVRCQAPGDLCIHLCVLRRRLSGERQLLLERGWLAQAACTRAHHRPTASSSSSKRSSGCLRSHRRGLHLRLRGRQRHASTPSDSRSPGAADARQTRGTGRRFLHFAVERLVDSGGRIQATRPWRHCSVAGTGGLCEFIHRTRRRPQLRGSRRPSDLFAGEGPFLSPKVLFRDGDFRLLRGFMSGYRGQPPLVVGGGAPAVDGEGEVGGVQIRLDAYVA